MNRLCKPWLPLGLKPSWLGFHLRHKAYQSVNREKERVRERERKVDGWMGRTQTILLAHRHIGHRVKSAVTYI